MTLSLGAQAPCLGALPAASQHCAAAHLPGPGAGGHAAADPTKLGEPWKVVRKMVMEIDGN